MRQAAFSILSLFSSAFVDRCVIQPAAAISPMPYAPKERMEALRHCYYNLGDKIWTDYGSVDGFSVHQNGYAKSHIGIDQSSIIVMIENYSARLMWDLFMKIPDLQNGLKKVGFTSPMFKKIKVNPCASTDIQKPTTEDFISGAC